MKYLKWSAVFIGLIGLDQGVKYLVSRYFPGDITQNLGIIFGIKLPHTSYFVFFFLLLIAILFWLSGVRKILPLVFIFGGGISNLLDRIFFGYVRDFVNLKFLPIFNLADIFIVLGIVVLFYPYTKKPRRQTEMGEGHRL